jgi:hypothetical protein
MRKFLFLTIITLFFAGCNQKEEKSASADEPGKKASPNDTSQSVSNYTIPDLSPMDMIYYPSDYPLKKMSGTVSTLPFARIIYSRPQKQGRTIFGELVKYNEPWRLGANEATELELFSTAIIQNKAIKPGRYILYCIPQETKWTIVLNSNLYSWGLKPDKEKNLFQFEIPIEKNNTTIEYFTMAFEGSGKNTNLLILWDDIKTKLPISF